MNKLDLDKQDKMFLAIIDMLQVHILYWIIIILLIWLMKG